MEYIPFSVLRLLVLIFASNLLLAFDSELQFPKASSRNLTSIKPCMSAQGRTFKFCFGGVNTLWIDCNVKYMFGPTVHYHAYFLWTDFFLINTHFGPTHKLLGVSHPLMCAPMSDPFVHILFYYVKIIKRQ